jgi:lipopolysaccharide/colanic/teichoic acid biosynthesis glycosyltransferase
VAGADKTTEAPTGEGPTLRDFGRRQYPKRLFDIFGAAILLITTAPLFVAITLLIAIDVGLPVVFWQHRPGRFGRHFKLYKFRTMRAPHDEQGNRIADEVRLSKFGTLVRLSRLDELPQLYNILVGEMSFVGPRPLLVTDHEPGTQVRLTVRPGLTGWAQVNGGRKLAPEDKAALDIWYVAHLSLALDLKIALRTLLLLFSGEHINQEAVCAARRVLATQDVSSDAIAVVARSVEAAATAQSAA